MPITAPIADYGFRSARSISLLFVAGLSAQAPDWHVQPMLTAFGTADSGSLCVVHDEARGRLVAFESSALAQKARTWEAIGGAWTLRPTPTAPTPRTAYAMAYHRARQRTVLFGGCTSFTQLDGTLDDTWEWDGFQWEQRSPVLRPTVRCRHAMAFDPISQRVLAAGGRGGLFLLSDTWAFDGTQWTQVALAGLISPVNAPMATDGNRAVVWSNGLTTLEWSGTAWVQQTPTSTPASSLAVAMASAPGGGVRLWRDNELWRWNGTTWRLESNGASPPTVTGGPTPAMAHDPVSGSALLFGSTVGTQAFDGTTWSTAVVGAPFIPYLAALDHARDRLVVLTLANQTFEWNGQTWQEGAAAPAHEAALVYDERRARCVLIAPAPSDWDGVGWQTSSPTLRPSRLDSATYDPLRQRIVASAQGSMWAWDGSAWTALGAMPISGPMTFDRARGRLVVVSSAVTAEWDGNTWTQSSNPTAVADRTNFALGYDEARARVVLQGGQLLSTFPTPIASAATWEWDGSSWSQLSTAQSVPPRHAGWLCFDRGRDRLLYVGSQRREARNGGIYFGTDIHALESAPDADVVAIGQSCGGPGGQLQFRGAIPKLAVGHWSLDLRAAPNRPTVFALGLSRATTPIGPCIVQTSLDLLLPTVTSAAGVAAVDGPLPDLPALRGLGVFAQAAALDGGPIGGFSLTQGLILTIR